MSEGPKQRRVTSKLDRVAMLLALTIVSVVCCWISDNAWLSSAATFLAISSAIAAIGVAFGYWRTGLLVGIVLGALYLFWAIKSIPRGYVPPPGWPMFIPRDR
jgi:hypothetical protein